jgi:hypothetical protein
LLGLVAAARVGAVALAAAGGGYDYTSLLHGPQCRPHHRASASLPAWERPRRMTVVTDSVLLGAGPALRKARPCWRVGMHGSPGLAAPVARRELSARRRPVAPVVVIGLGYNSNWEPRRAHFAFWAKRFDRDARQLLAALRRRGARQFVWVTLREPTAATVPPEARGELPLAWYLPYVNERLRRLDKRRDDLTLADWARASRRRGLTSDAIHLTPRGARLMVRTIRRAISAEGLRQAG